MIGSSTNDDDMTELLKARYFDIASKEDYPKTPDVTSELDKIEKAIRKRKRDERPQGLLHDR